jgi:signal transduction histidine kinase
MVERPDVGLRLQRAIDDLDDTIRQVRSTIFALQVEPEDRRLRSRLHRVIDRAAESLGFAPAVRMDGLIDTEVDQDVGDNLLAVLEEALSNTVRHARATAVSVSVEVGDEVVLRVADDGAGIAPGGRRSGLRNIAERAAALGGTFEIRTPDGGGTELDWRVPAKAPEPSGP